MDRYAVLVDAGYFFAAGAQTITKNPTSRRHISLVSPANFIRALIEKTGQQALMADATMSLSRLLRVYWYDALLGPRPSLEQTTIAHLAGVKLRLGSMNNAGEQKGVDSLIVTDLIDLARNRAVSDAVLVSGDEDLRVAVQVAQTYGVRVHVLAVGDPKKSVSTALQMEADSVDTLDEKWLKKQVTVATVTARPVSTPSTAAPVSTSTSTPNNIKSQAGASLDAAAQRVCDELVKKEAVGEVQQLNSHFDSSTAVPPEYDGKLIAKTATILGRQLTAEEKRRARGIFVKHVRALK